MPPEAYRPAGELVALAEEVARRRPELGVRAREMPVVCETQTLRRHGRKAITIAGYDPGTGSLPHWHTCADTPEALSQAALTRAREFLWELVGLMDEQA